MRCKEIKLKLCIAFIILSVLGANIGIIVWQVKSNEPAPSPTRPLLPGDASCTP